MRNAIILSGLAGLVAAAPAPAPQQDGIDFDVIAAAGEPVVTGAPAIATVLSVVPTYNPSVAAASASAAAEASPVATAANEKREAAATTASCTKLPNGAGPVATPDTVSAFLNNPALASSASAAPTPNGYSNVFTDLNGATQQAGYMGYYTLNSYDTVKCSQYCDQADGCNAFNIYYERDPTYIPAPGCDNPASTTNIKCSLYSLPISSATATNNGQWQDQFQVAITGSNGYVSLAPPPSYPSFTGPSDRLGGSIVAPLVNGKDTFIGSRMFTGAYDPSQCAAACQSTTSFDKAHLVASDGTYKACNFFNSFVVSKNNAPQGTYCQFYTQPWGRQYATNNGQYDSQGNYYAVSESYGYSLNPQDPGVTTAQ